MNREAASGAIDAVGGTARSPTALIGDRPESSANDRLNGKLRLSSNRRDGAGRDGVDRQWSVQRGRRSVKRIATCSRGAIGVRARGEAVRIDSAPRGVAGE